MLERIERESRSPGLLATLAKRLPLTDLQSLLLEVYRQRSAQVTPSSLLERYSKNRFVAPSDLHPLVALELDRLAFGLLPEGFTAIELSPVCPLGAVSAVAEVDPYSVLTTIRNTEVVADPTNVLALECAIQRRKRLGRDRHDRSWVRLAASQRVVRTQPVSGPASRQHFRMLALCTAGRDEGSFQFEVASLLEQIGFYLELMAASAQLDYAVVGVRVGVTDLDPSGQEPLLKRAALATLAEQFPAVRFGFEDNWHTARSYYSSVRFNVYATNPSGVELQLVDGGFTTWTQQLLSNAKERLLISGMGTERFCTMFRESAQP